MLTTAQGKLLMAIEGLRDQVEKSHFLNAHFRAFEIAHDCWKEHIRMNALSGSRACNSPAGAVLDDDRDDIDTPNAQVDAPSGARSAE